MQNSDKPFSPELGAHFKTRSSKFVLDKILDALTQTEEPAAEEPAAEEPAAEEPAAEEPAAEEPAAEEPAEP